MNCDTHHPISSGLLDEKQLHDARDLFDRLCAELHIDSPSARDMAAGLMITMFTNGQRDAGHIRSALQRFAAELPSNSGSRPTP